MAQAAYNLEHFAPARKQQPRVRVAKTVRKQHSAQRKQFNKSVRMISAVLVFVAMLSGVLYTQAAVTEVTTQIAERKQDIKEEEAFNTYLSFQLDNKTSLKNIEEAAVQMGLAKVDSGQISYFRVKDGSDIEVKDSFFTTLLNNTKHGFMSIVDYLTV